MTNSVPVDYVNTKMNDVEELIEDAEELMQDAASASGERASEIRARVSEKLALAREKIALANAKTTKQARAAAKATDDYVHDNPWQAIGVAAGVGFLLGLLVSRR